MNTTASTNRILIVEEDETLRLLLSRLLEEEGFQAETVSTLEAALKKVDERVYDLVLTELLAKTPPTRGDPQVLRPIQQLRQRCRPTPVGVITAWPVDLTAAERAGFAFALSKPYDIDEVLRRIADRLNSARQTGQQQEQHLRRLLEAMSQGNEETLRALCIPSMSFYPLTGSIFTQERSIIGLNAYLAYLRLVRQRLPGYRIEQVHVFAQRGRLIARYLITWQGRDGQRQGVSASMQCHFHGERISQIGEALPTAWLRACMG